MASCLRKSALIDHCLFFVTALWSIFLLTLSLIFDRMVVPWSSFQHLSKQQKEEDYAMNPEFVKLATRLIENYGGDDSQFKDFFQVACGCKHTLLLNKKG